MPVPQVPIDVLSKYFVLSDNLGRLLSTAANPDGTSSLVAQAITPVGAATNAQTVFLAGSGNQALSVAGNFRIAVVNPAGSGKTLHIFKFDSYATASGMGELYVGTPLAALTGVPTAARRINNVAFGSGVASVAQVYADTNTTTALGGGRRFWHRHRHRHEPGRVLPHRSAGNAGAAGVLARHQCPVRRCRERLGQLVLVRGVR